MSVTKMLLVLICFGVINILSMPLNNFGIFLENFIALRSKSATILSYMNFTPSLNTALSKNLSRMGILYAVNNKQIDLNKTLRHPDNTIFLLNFEDRRYLDILKKAQANTGTLRSPSCWILFYKMKYSNTNATTTNPEYVKDTIENLLADINIGVNTEVYISIVNGEELDIYLIYKKRPHLSFIWEKRGKWNSNTNHAKLYPINSSDSLAMKRKNMEQLQVTTTAVYKDKQSLLDSKNFVHHHEDSPTKIMYYMAVHLFEWINATGYFNITNTWGYKGSDGTFKGIMKELEDGRSDFSGSILIPSRDRMHIVEYVIPPGPFDLFFVFRKPALASTSNIYVLPFTNAVWVATIILCVILTVAVFATSSREATIGKKPVTAFDRVAESIQDILRCVFQQGTPQEPVTFSGRQILFSGLLAFMFLYTAYAANVVALLQSSDNNINSVESLLNSRLQCGAHNVVYNRFIFNTDNRPTHRALWLKKGLPQGERFFLSVDEGIRRVKKEMFAFHVEAIAGFYTLQKTFLEHEKCNIGTVKYADFKYPYFGVGKYSPIKEALRIGAIRIKESGVQERSNQRISARVPSCSSGTGMFTAVDLLDVAPAFKSLLALYALAIVFFAIELILHRQLRVKRPNGIDVDETTTKNQLIVQGHN